RRGYLPPLLWSHHERVRSRRKERPRRRPQEGVGRAVREPKHQVLPGRHLDPGNLLAGYCCAQLTGAAARPRLSAPAAPFVAHRRLHHGRDRGRARPNAVLYAGPMKLVILDCDGTLVDSQNGICEAMVHAFSGLGLAAPSRAATLAIVGLSLPEAF